MAKRNRKKSLKRPLTPKARSAECVRAGERSRAAGGYHKDKRTRRQTRRSWRKELDI